MRLILTLHHHQPIGQLPWTVSDAINNCYAPLLKVLSRHPSIKVTLHYSGPLLEILAEDHPFIIDQIKVLLERGQIELIGGAWWEAILPIWPLDDQIAQLQLSKDRLKVLFDCDPQFAWLPERVWEPHLEGTLRQSNYQGTFLDANGLKNAGASPPNLHRMNHTTQGLKVLSIDAQLRRLIPWLPVKDVLKYLSDLHQQDSQSIAIFADDAEKFGSWPGTFQLIYEEHYLEDLLTTFEESADWLQIVLPSSCDESEQNPLEISPTSYPEMLEWSGGNWRRFLERYQESRDMYETVSRAPRTLEALPHLLKAQCNDAYWHGVFGGLYLPHLRQAIYGAVAKSFMASSEPKSETTSYGDVMLKSSTQILGFHPNGGQLFQWLDLEKGHNWLATLRHYPENYATEKEAGDWYARGSGIEHFLGTEVLPESIVTGRFAEEGDFSNENWQIETQRHKDNLCVTLTRSGGVWQQNIFAPLEINKRINLPLRGNKWTVHYEFTNPGEQVLDLWWASEWNISPSGSNFPERSFSVENKEFSLEEIHYWENISCWNLTDKWLKSTLQFSSNQNFDLWQLPFRTISRHEGETMESIFQQATIVMHRKVLLQPGQKYFCAATLDSLP